MLFSYRQLRQKRDLLTELTRLSASFHVGADLDSVGSQQTLTLCAYERLVRLIIVLNHSAIRWSCHEMTGTNESLGTAERSSEKLRSVSVSCISLL